MTAPVIAGYDGTPESRDALALARLLAEGLGTPLVVLSVVTAARFEIDRRMHLADLDEQGERLVADAREALMGAPEVEAIVRAGSSPPQELDRLARERDARVVVLGSTHRGGLGPRIARAPCVMI
jgi:nucleotide-binding universal stress UspA family protein